eukprot:TRINITY_DN2297_c0_g1_i1.p3 TRINITY_DN2297_c0_g1~~TRINITY_DN2297_c0_g1_i1.p3  ORF type:complete len:105 (+),score=8.51 TRINITY_DN2297_c0_g1_i1:292-606(+)
MRKPTVIAACAWPVNPKITQIQTRTALLEAYWRYRNVGKRISSAEHDHDTVQASLPLSHTEGKDSRLPEAPGKLALMRTCMHSFPSRKDFARHQNTTNSTNGFP